MILLPIQHLRKKDSHLHTQVLLAKGQIRNKLLGGVDFSIFSSKMWVQGLAESGCSLSEDWQNLGTKIWALPQNPSTHPSNIFWMTPKVNISFFRTWCLCYSDLLYHVFRCKSKQCYPNNTAFWKHDIGYIQISQNLCSCLGILNTIFYLYT